MDEWIYAIQKNTNKLKKGKGYLCYLDDNSFAILILNEDSNGFLWEPLIPYDGDYLTYNPLARVKYFRELPDPPDDKNI